MKKITILFVVFAFFACKNEQKPKEDIDITKAAPIEKTQGIATNFNLVKDKSNIAWIASKAIGKHNGNLPIASGRINVVDGNITTGDIEFDMKNLTVLDLKDQAEKTDLETHLKDSDFFDAQNFPLSRFVISKAERIENNPQASHKVSGDLTIKGITNPISFLAAIKMDENTISATSESFSINRTKWKITYSSTLIGTALDKAIKDDIVLKVNILAAKN